ncbi:MAG: type II toxin-antitoxin system prevent-host-death family antitoxin [Erysipelotrichaceae bacterium]|nr:type II toxin-antitoxin system prevent-host-death family antitoxin [Erysipelotrichaceae bacterium]
MIATIATATQMQNNFGKYLNLVMKGQEVIVTKNGKEIRHFVPKNTVVSYLGDSLTGILKNEYSLDDIKTD